MILQESIRTKQPAVREIFTQPQASTTFQTVVKSKAAVFVLISFLLCILLFQGLGSPSIYILDEARNAQCAKEMEQNGTFIVPTFNGKLRTDKPPLHYFFMIAAYKMMGVSSFSARFFSALFGLLTIGIIALFANKYIGQQTAVLTTIILSCSAQFIFEFRLAVPDPYFIFFTVAGMLSGFIWMKDNRVSFLYLSAILNGFGVLAKGPVAILLPAIAFLIFTFYKKSWKNFFTWHLVTASLAFLAIALPWYLLVHQATGGQWTKSFFLEHNFGRYASPKDGHGGFFLVPLFVTLVGLLPFSTFVAETVKKRKIVFTNDALIFSLIVFAIIVVFFSLSATQLPNYTMPAYPFGAMVIGHYLSKALNQQFKLPVYPFYIITVVFCLLPIAVFFVLRSEEQTKNMMWIAALLLIPAIMFIVFMRIIKGMATSSRVLGVATISFVFNTLMLFVVYPLVYNNNPVAKTLPIIKTAPRVIAYKHYNAGYNFYLNQPITRFDGNQIDSIKMSLPGTLIITSSDLAKELDSLHLKTVAWQHDIFERRETVILTK